MFLSCPDLIQHEGNRRGVSIELKMAARPSVHGMRVRTALIPHLLPEQTLGRSLLRDCNKVDKIVWKTKGITHLNVLGIPGCQISLMKSLVISHAHMYI